MKLAVPLNAELQQVSDLVFVEPSPPRNFIWLHQGVRFPVRPEPRNGRIYWYMRKMINRQIHNEYLAAVGSLTAVILNETATAILSDACPVKPS